MHPPLGSRATRANLCAVCTLHTHHRAAKWAKWRPGRWESESGHPTPGNTPHTLALARAQVRLPSARRVGAPTDGWPSLRRGPSRPARRPQFLHLRRQCIQVHVLFRAGSGAGAREAKEAHAERGPSAELARGLRQRVYEHTRTGARARLAPSRTIAGPICHPRSGHSIMWMIHPRAEVGGGRGGWPPARVF